MINRGNLVVQDIRVGFIKMNSLLDHGLIIFVQRESGTLEGAWTFQVTGLDFENVEPAISVLIDPFAD